MNYGLYLLLVLFACAGGCSDEQTAGNRINANQTAQNNNEQAGIAAPYDRITGTWKLQLDAYDLNENQVLEEDERKKGTPNNYMLQLDPDGACRMQQVFSGRYEIQTEKGKKVLKVQRKRIETEEDEDPIPDVYHIKSVTKDELILLVIDGGEPTTFWIFKRVK